MFIHQLHLTLQKVILQWSSSEDNPSPCLDAAKNNGEIRLRISHDVSLITDYDVWPGIKEVLCQLLSVSFPPDLLSHGKVAVHLIANQNDTTIPVPSTKLL